MGSSTAVIWFLSILPRSQGMGEGDRVEHELRSEHVADGEVFVRCYMRFTAARSLRSFVLSKASSRSMRVCGVVCGRRRFSAWSLQGLRG